MNYHLKFTSAFKKAYKRSQKRGLNIQKLDAIIDELRQGNPLPAKYHDHALTGKMSCFRCSRSMAIRRKRRAPSLTPCLTDSSSRAAPTGDLPSFPAASSSA